jgi:2-haloacid dehalogenase
MAIPDVGAILFDVFGTVVDWRGGIVRAGEALGDERGLRVDWSRFADAWRSRYRPSMDRVREGAIPWTKLDALHRRSLDDVVEELGIRGLDARDRDRLTHAWHELDPWPDVLPGLERLRARYIVAPLSNGHVALLTNMAKRARIPWDLILSAELARRYKPDLEVYTRAADLLDLPPERVLMAAAHADDLRAAARAGLRTAFVHRPLEWGPERAASSRPPDPAEFDLAVRDLVDLADRLGV